jgi:hypothetical protein
LTAMNAKQETKQVQANKPPYGSPSWYKKFLELVRAHKPDKVDAKFLSINGIAKGNEAKVIVGLRFLGLITADGVPTEKLNSLRVVGDEFKKNLSSVVNEAYADLKSKVALETAKPENLLNYMVSQHDLAGKLADNAARVFVLLCVEAGIPISEELQKWQSGLVESKPKLSTEKGIKRLRKKGQPEVEKKTAFEVVELKVENVIIALPKADTLSAAKKARSLLEWYIKENSK